MDRLIATGSVPLGGADTAPVSGTPQYATNGVPGVTNPTQFPAYQYNAIQEEIVQAILGAGIALDRASNAQLLAAIRALGAAVVGHMRNLSGSAAGGTQTASWTVDELVAEVALGGLCYKGKSLSLSFNGAGTGANGMDTGSPPISGDLYIYAIFNPTSVTWSTLGTTAGSGAAIYGGVNMPAGYTASALIWAGKTDGSRNVKQFHQVDRRISIQEATALSGGTAVTLTSVSLSSIVPVNAKAISGSVLNTNAGSSTNVAGDNSGTGTGFVRGGGVNSSFALDLITPQVLFYLVGGGAGSIFISAYSI